MKKYNERVFPSKKISHWVAGPDHFASPVPVYEETGGLSLRAHFAGQIACGLVGKYTLNKPEDQETLAKMAVQLADALIAELDHE